MSDLRSTDPGVATAERAPLDVSAVLRLVRLLISAVDAAGPAGLRFTSDSAIYCLARALLAEAVDDTGMARTTLMALRDLVWRVDTARAILGNGCNNGERLEIERMLDTSDVHLFLRQCAQDTVPGKKTAADAPARG